METPFFKSLHLQNFLSFGPETKPLPITSLNVVIGPNGSGKSNLIEAFELLHATPTDLTAPIRDGGGVAEWLWKGTPDSKPAILTAVLNAGKYIPELRYRLALSKGGHKLDIDDEFLENTKKKSSDDKDVFFYYRYQNGNPVINVRKIEISEDDPRAVPPWQESSINNPRGLSKITVKPDQSVLSQRKDPDMYPELTRVATQFGMIQTFREWSFGRYAALRQPQPADLPNDILLPDARNLGMVLNNLEHSDCWPRLMEIIPRFLPRFTRLSTKIQGGNVQIYLHEDGLKTPVPATRLSDGTIRFLSLLAILLKPEPAPVVCIEEPEMGLHPDALSIIAELLVEASSKTQLVVTTHSDVLVSALTEHADSVLVSEHHAGGSSLRRLESEKLKFWLDKYRLGDIWRMGELGGNL